MIIDTETLMHLHVEYDWDPECPTEDGSHDVISFCSRHVNFKEPTDELIKEIEEKVAKGKAFWLDCYQHSGTRWSRHMTGYICQWDTALKGGVLLVSDDDAVGSEEKADNFLEVYNQWCNGDVYSFRLEVDGEVVEACCGFYNPPIILDEVVWAVQQGESKQVILNGDALYIIQPELNEKLKELNIEVVDL